jgi:hypothetical protein
MLKGKLGKIVKIISGGRKSRDFRSCSVRKEGISGEIGFFYSFVSVKKDALILSAEVYSQNQFKQKIIFHQKEGCFKK